MKLPFFGFFFQFKNISVLKLGFFQFTGRSRVFKNFNFSKEPLENLLPSASENGKVFAKVESVPLRFCLNENKNLKLVWGNILLTLWKSNPKTKIFKLRKKVRNHIFCLLFLAPFTKKTCGKNFWWKAMKSTQNFENFSNVQLFWRIWRLLRFWLPKLNTLDKMELASKNKTVVDSFWFVSKLT